MTQPRSARPSRSSRPSPSSQRPSAPRLSALHLPPDSLGYALDGAARAITAVSQGSALPAALAAVQAAQPAAAQPLSRGAIQDIAYRAMRRLGTAEWLVGTLVSKAPPEHVRALLACALALLLDEQAEAAYTPFTVVDQAVTAVGARREFAFAKGLVNAVLRRFLRERETFAAQWQADRGARWNYRGWWIDAVERAWPEHWQSILAAAERPGPLTLRVNARHTDVDAYLATLREHGIEADAVGRHAVRLASPLPVDRIPASPTAWSRCRTRARNWPPSGWARATECACSTPARRRAARPGICSNWPMSRWWHWRATRRAPSASARTWRA